MSNLRMSHQIILETINVNVDRLIDEWWAVKDEPFAERERALRTLEHRTPDFKVAVFSLATEELARRTSEGVLAALGGREVLKFTLDIRQLAINEFIQSST
jgi:hypothetical protein